MGAPLRRKPAAGVSVLRLKYKRGRHPSLAGWPGLSGTHAAAAPQLTAKQVAAGKEPWSQSRVSAARELDNGP